jgi:hypothetical protein
METQTTATVGVPTQGPKFWGETYGYWCQTAVLAGAAILAWIAIVSARRIERKKASIGFIFEGKHDKELTTALQMIAALHDGEKKMSIFAKKENLNSDESKRIRYALNHFESMGVGIFCGIYDEQTLKSSQYNIVTRLYERTKTYIETIRTEENGKPTHFQEIECLACRWLRKPLAHKPITAVQAHSIKNLFGL